jgi:hypothetical protein
MLNHIYIYIQISVIDILIITFLAIIMNELMKGPNKRGREDFDFLLPTNHLSFLHTWYSMVPF